MTNVWTDAIGTGLERLWGEAIASDELRLVEPDDSGCVDIGGSVVDNAGSTILLRPRRTFSSRWLWYNAFITGTTGRSVTLEIETANSWVTMVGSVGHGVWSYDGITWNRWNSQTFVSSPSRVRFTNTTPFTQPFVQVAYWPAYTAANLASDIATWVASPYVQPTDSADAGLVVGTTAARDNGFGRLCPAANLYGFKIEDESIVGDKNVGMLVCGNHCGEHSSQHAFRNAINFLLSDDPRAELIRSCWIFLVYPDVNPQGRYGGLFRCSPDALTSDYNRIWGTATSGTQVTVRTAMDADVAAHAPNGLNFFDDWHGYNFDYGGGSNFLDTALTFNQTGRKHPEWQTRMQVYDAAWNWTDWPTAVNTLHEYVEDNYDDAGSLRVAKTSECGSTVAFGQPEYERYGDRIMQALADASELGGIFPESPPSSSSFIASWAVNSNVFVLGGS